MRALEHGERFSRWRAELEPLGATGEVFCGFGQAQSGLWRFDGDGGPLAFLKEHGSARRFNQELEAYRRFLPALGCSVPRLLGADSGSRSLLLSALDGQPWQPEGEGNRASLIAAGRWLSRLHALDFVDHDPVSLRQALRRRVAACVAELGLEQPRLQQRLEQVVLELGQFAELRRVFCHRDFHPGNCLVQGAGAGTMLPAAFAVVDFEHSKGDHWTADLCRLDGVLATGVELEALLWASYGRGLDASDTVVYELYRLLDAARTWTWARRHGDAVFLERGAWRLRRLGVWD